MTCPGEGFQGKDCKCYCKGNPIRECDDNNEEVNDSKFQVVKDFSLSGDSSIAGVTT